jgi:serine/threonine-protein kinase HipA
VEAGRPLDPALDDVLLHGSSIGGAWPKALIDNGEKKLIAKFSSSTDTYAVLKGEFIAMRLAQLAGLDVAHVEMENALGKDVLLVDRFDRVETVGGWYRRAMISALTILELYPEIGRYATYVDFAHAIRERFTEPSKTLRELFSRIVFNVLVGNTDDHAKNHAAYWDGASLSLTPAYDICPLPRMGGESQQAMAFGKGGYRFSRLEGCIESASIYLLSESEARSIVDQQIECIRENWDIVCDEAKMTEVDRNRYWGSAFLNPYAFDGYRS